jgi:hypothetical protein
MNGIGLPLTMFECAALWQRGREEDVASKKIEK